jgi:hypothetical protein
MSRIPITVAGIISIQYVYTYNIIQFRCTVLCSVYISLLTMQYMNPMLFVRVFSFHSIREHRSIVARPHVCPSERLFFKFTSTYILFFRRFFFDLAVPIPNAVNHVRRFSINCRENFYPHACTKVSCNNLQRCSLCCHSKTKIYLLRLYNVYNVQIVNKNENISQPTG